MAKTTQPQKLSEIMEEGKAKDFLEFLEKMKRRISRQEYKSYADASHACKLCNDSRFVFDKEKNVVYRCECADVAPANKKLMYYFESSLAREYNCSNWDDFSETLPSDKESRHKLHKHKEILMRYADNYPKIIADFSGRGLYLYSNQVGSGKTMMACIVANHISVQFNATSQILSSIELISLIKDTFNRVDSSELVIINPLIAVDVLIIDDLGSEKWSDWVAEKMHQIIESRRSRGKVTIITSNYAPSELDIPQRTLSRIERHTIPLKFPAYDARKALSNLELDRLAKEVFNGK